MTDPAFVPKDRVQVKICGLTDPETAAACADMGADAVGLVFYPRSPRNVSIGRAKAICEAVGGRTFRVGVFVNPALDDLLHVAKTCGLDGVQLHGNEPADMARAIQAEGFMVIKALFYEKTLDPAFAAGYPADAFLAECGGGPLPGGNAMDWDWAAAGALSRRHATILAGGLAADCVVRAMAAARPHAVDVSSGVERAPGVKDLERVKAFLKAVAGFRPAYAVRKVFWSFLNDVKTTGQVNRKGVSQCSSS